MSRPTVTVISPKGESSKDTIAVPNVFKVSHCDTTAQIRKAAANCKYTGLEVGG